jgi:hypothetical protein
MAFSYSRQGIARSKDILRPYFKEKRPLSKEVLVSRYEYVAVIINVAPEVKNVALLIAPVPFKLCLMIIATCLKVFRELHWEIRKQDLVNLLI